MNKGIVNGQLGVMDVDHVSPARFDVMIRLIEIAQDSSAQSVIDTLSVINGNYYANYIKSLHRLKDAGMIA